MAWRTVQLPQILNKINFLNLQINYKNVLNNVQESPVTFQV